MLGNRVFVYGTLKKGEPNHDWILDKTEGISQFMCKAETVDKYPLIIASKYNIPFLLDVPGRGHNVVGELYEVDDRMLRHLDVLEDHPNFYVREIREVQFEHFSESGNKTLAWIYLIKDFRPSLLNEPFLKEYFSEGDHGKPYEQREARDPTYNAKSDIQQS